MDTSDFIALASTVVALSALGVSIWQGYVMREHNKLSVMPLLYVDKDTREGSDIELTVLNQGVGPAIITSFALYCDENQYLFPTTKQYAEILVSLGLDPKQQVFTADIPIEGNVIKDGSSFSVIKFIGSGQNAELHKQITSVLPRLSLEIVYQSVYQESKMFKYVAA